MSKITFLSWVLLAMCLIMCKSTKTVNTVPTGIIGMSGFRVSDWNNAGTVLYAAKTDTIYSSVDRGNSWAVWYTFPDDPDMIE